MHRYVGGMTDIELLQVDSAPRWRSIYTYAVWKRVIGGSLQLLRDYVRFIIILFKRPDLVHLTTSGNLAVIRDLVISMLAWLCHIPIVYHLRFGRVPDIAGSNSMEWQIMKWVMRMANVTIAITPFTYQTINEYLPQIRVEYVPNPIDFTELPISWARKETNKRVLFLGWVIPAKGIEELVNVWTQLDLEDWTLQIVGPGDNIYKQHLIEKYNPRNLYFIGELGHQQAMELMSQCDIFVLPSYTEGFPNVILEAMALGKAIVATRVGAISDMLAGECGILVEPKNVEDLRLALLQLVYDESFRLQLGRQAYAKAREKYSIDIVFARYIEIWQSLCSERRNT